MNQSFKAFVNEITVDSKCSLNELLTEFYKAAGKHISFSEITEQEKIDFRKMTEEMDIHESFVGHFLENFNESITPLGLFEVVKHIASIAETTDVRIALEKLFRHPEATEHMKDYVKVWLMQPLQVFDKLTEFLSEMLFDDELILNTALNDKKLFIKATKKALIHPEDFNLVSFIVYNENDIPARIHSRTEESLALEIAGVESVKDVRERIVTIKMDDLKGPETGLDGLRNATDCLLKIHQAYPTMQANMINYSTRSINSSMMGGARLSPAQVVRLYAGDYSNYENPVGEVEEGNADDAAHSAVRGLITNPEAFDALPPAGRRLVAQHLPATRKQFNQIVVNAINSVHTWMPQLLNAHTENRELNRVIDGLAKSYNSLTGNQQGMVDWFMHKFAPAVNAYRARALPSTGIAVVDNVFGGSPLKTATRIYGSGMSGGVRTVYVNHNESTEAPRFYGGGPIADYYEGVKRTQLRFNDQFDSLYRKLTAAVRMVADKGQFTVEQGINRVIEALMSITIASKKTVMKISGLKPKEDLNVRYTAMVEHVIKTIDNTKIGGFGEVISVLRSLVSLLKSTHQEARSLIKKVSESTKSSEEIVRFIDFKHEEMPSKLSAQELHALVESINALVYAKRGHQLTAKIERHRDEEIKEYIRKVTNRTEAINGHYENQLDKWLKYNTHTHIDTKSLIKSHIKSVQAAMVYLNEKVDTKLMQWRQKMARGGNITKKQIEDIERLTMTYMHYRPGEKILQIFAKLEKLRKEVTDDLSIGDIYKVTGVIQKIVMNAGYVEMIQQLYKTLEIDDGSFDWNLFKINITKLLVDKMLVVTGNIFTVSCDEKLNGDGLFGAGGDVSLRDTPAYYRVAKCLTEALKTKLDLPHRQLFNLVCAFLTPNKATGAATAIHHALNLRATDGLYAGYLCNSRDQVIAKAPTRLTGDSKLMPLETWEIAKDIAGAGKEAAYEAWTNEIAKRVGIEGFNGVDGYKYENIKIEAANQVNDNLTHAYDRFRVLILDHMTQIMQKNKVYGLYDRDKLLRFATEARAAFIVPMKAEGDLDDRTKAKDAYPILKLAKQDVGITWDGFFGLSNETPIIVDIFHSMIANVIYVFNRYIALRYTGNSNELPVPMMTSAMLGGNAEEFGVGSAMEGTKMEAGSAIDVIGVHDLNFDKVIPEAVPFYAIAVDLFNTFMKEFWRGIDNDVTPKTKFGDNVFRMYVNVSEFSILHNLHEIFKDYTIIDDKKYETDKHQADLTLLSEVQLKMIVAELNKVWNLVSGSGKEKLMNAIDYLISEINSSILFTTKSRYEMLKRDGHLDLDVSSKLEQQFSGVLDTLKETITTNLNTVTAMNPNAMAEFETWLTASTERIAKETNETARINYLRGIINGQDADKYKNPFEDYYKFCEFVMTPIMITATGYKEAFKLFDNLRASGAAEAKTSIDLNKYKIALMKKGVSVIDGSLANESDYIDATADTGFIDVKDICKDARAGNLDTDAKKAAAASLVNSPVVAHYNTLLIRRELKRAIATNTPFVMPQLWLPLIPSTYPAEKDMELKVGNDSYIPDDKINANIVAMRELYPHIKSDRPIDFFNALLADFSADFDHLLHTFMTYPGISDRFLMKLKDVHKDSATSLKKLIQETLIVGGKYLPNVLNSATIAKTTQPFVPKYPEDLNMQPYIGATNVPAISLQKYGDVKSSEYTMIGTGQKVYSIIFSTKESIATSGKQLCQYGPLDWVVYRLAACNTTGYTLPVMLYEMLKTNSLFGKYLIECIVEGTNVVYTPHSTGYVYNVVTQNILTRSSTDRNRQESAEFKTMNKSWLANLVSTIPGLVSYIKALSVSTESSVKDYNGVSIEQLYVTLSSILESFYEECMTYMPFVPFMSDFIPGTFYASIERKMTKYHPIAEIYASMLNEKCECDGLKFEWANRAYYSGTLQISFPEYKNRDKYEDLKKWGGDLFQNSLFAQEFNGTMDIIARAIVRHRIIRRNANLKTAEQNSVSNEELINICLRAAKKCYELDPKVTSIFINNILNFSKASVRGMLGGGIYSTNPLNTNVSTATSGSIIKLLNGIFDGLNGIIKAGADFPTDPSLDELITAAISLLYDNPNVRAYYTFKDGADDYKTIGNLMRGNEAEILGALGGAAEGMPDDYTARSKQLLAFSAVNVKADKKIDANATVYDMKGTIETSARYVTRNTANDLTFDRFRELIKPAYYNPADMLKTEPAGDPKKPDGGSLSELVGKLINGYANSSRLAIASNAMATLTRAVFEIADISTVIDGVIGDDNDRKCLYELFNWLSLAREAGGKILRPKADAVVAGCAVPADYVAIGGDVDAIKAIANVTGDAHKHVRFDGVDGNYTLTLDALKTAGTNGTAVFTEDNKSSIAKVMRAIAEIDALDKEEADDLKKAVIMVANGANQNADYTTATDYTAGTTTANTTTLFGKEFTATAGRMAGDATHITSAAATAALKDGAVVLKWMLSNKARTDTADAETIANQVISNTSIAALNRLVLTYYLCSRWALPLAKWVRTGAEAAAGTILLDFLKCLGYQRNFNAIAEAKLVDAFELLATVIEIGCKAPLAFAGSESGMITLVNALGSKIITNAQAAYAAADAFAFPDGALAEPRGATRDVRVANATKLGASAILLFDIFFDGKNNAPKLKKFTDALGGGALAAGKNAFIWSFILTGGYFNGIVFNAADDNRIVVNHTDRYTFGLSKASFAPLDGNFKSLTIAETSFFGEKIEVKEDDPIRDAAKRGVGRTPADLLNALTEGDGLLAVEDKNDTLAGLIYAGVKYSEFKAPDHINEFRNKAKVIANLRALGFLSLVCSNDFSIKDVNLGASTVNMLAASFEFQKDAFFKKGALKLPIIEHNLEDMCNGFANLLINQIQSPGVLSMSDFLKNVLPKLGSKARLNALNDAAKIISENIASGFIMGDIKDTFALAGNQTIGVQYRHPEAAIHLSRLPRVTPTITAYPILDKQSVRMYQFFPRSIGEYMLWNPMYELFNIRDGRKDAPDMYDDLINIPFNAIVEPSYTKNLKGGDNPDYWIANHNWALKFSFTPGLLSEKIYGKGKESDTWVTPFANNYRGASHKLDYSAPIYKTTEAELLIDIKDEPVVTKVDAAALTNKLTTVINDWCQDFDTKATNLRDNGDIGWSLNMLGGANVFDSYINTDGISAGEPYKIYPSIYRTTDDATGLTFYGTLFKQLSRTTHPIGALALAYFNRSLLTFSGVLSNYVYPNSIYGKGLFDKFSSSLSNVVKDLGNKVTDAKAWKTQYSDSGVIKNRWEFYSSYVQNFANTVDKTVINASDRALSPLNQCLTNPTVGEEATDKAIIRNFDAMTINNLATNAFKSTDANYQNKLSSEYTAPSICNSFLTILHNLIIGKTNNKEKPETDKDLKKMDWFIGTETMGVIRSVDSLLTYTAILSSLIKQLSFFDMDEDMERTYVTRDPAEPFMGVKPDDDRF